MIYSQCVNIGAFEIMDLSMPRVQLVVFIPSLLISRQSLEFEIDNGFRFRLSKSSHQTGG